MKSIILSYLLVCAISYISLSEAQTVLKAAAPANNVRDCFCQCSSLSFRDKNNRVNGNCRTTFNGGQWCYITDEAARNGDCPDSNPSTRFPGKKMVILLLCYSKYPSMCLGCSEKWRLLPSSF
ncbi:unnamed protein product [Lepeophtheirus salmonis]|uniref:(salmon louse) hypothetical protein n=1 Tax=Lepeophtheirus salmonis TaxID=72036 RepID=A0A7R8D4X7_LEPSM|nr:unnamed protein product [Lepeophtheirus salmonis]CAF3029905.1 unnamed protein product [Lepeophtheirus salmonis]